MHIVSWNVNGIRAITRKGDLVSLVQQHAPDILCLQEIRCDDATAQLHLTAYKDIYPHILFNTSKAKKGYSGVAVLSKYPLQERCRNLYAQQCYNNEGRLLVADVNGICLINVYTPNAGAQLDRLQFRTSEWDVAFSKMTKGLLDEGLNVVVVGDLNVARREIDIHDPKHLKKQAGFTIEERASFEAFMLNTNLVDVFRHCHPTLIKYSFWSNFGKARSKNKGWRIDYTLIKQSLLEHVENVDILDGINGSDHAPCSLTLCV